MRILLITASFFLLLGCASKLTDVDRYVGRYESVAIIDFSKYSDQGFLITPESYQGEYSSLGMINTVLRSPAILVDTLVKSSVVDNEYINKQVWIVERLDVQDALDLIYLQAVEMGGDAIMNFHITPNDKTHTDVKPFVTVPGVEISGIVIKRH